MPDKGGNTVRKQDQTKRKRRCFDEKQIRIRRSICDRTDTGSKETYAGCKAKAPGISKSQRILKEINPWHMAKKAISNYSNAHSDGGHYFFWPEADTGPLQNRVDSAYMDDGVEIIRFSR